MNRRAEDDSLAAGTMLGPYRIEARIGAGGMGDVYKARDTRLDRAVAVKVLPAAVAGDPDVRRRFEREARAISALRHPHICVLHDVGRQEPVSGSGPPVDFLVMEYLEGETLERRLEKGALPLDRALKHAIDIADALGRAHRAGVVHRDLKPANVMLTKDGAKLLDFGLARFNARSAFDARRADALTVPPNITAEGSILGTYQYMSPEQLEGKDADARADIFAFGAVVTEMATGQRAFAGSTQASLIGAILHGEPRSIRSLVPAAPHALDRVIAKCLVKDPDERWQDAADVASQLRWIAEGGSPSDARVHDRRAPTWLPWALAGALAALLVVIGAMYIRPERTSSPSLRTNILAPENLAFSSFDFALSPDGNQLAFVALTRAGASQLWVRPLDSLVAQPLAGTDGAQKPFWSPDSKAIGFFAGGRLKRVNAAGGNLQSIADTPQPRGGAWNRDGVIVFSPNSLTGLFRVSALGCAASPITQLPATAGVTSHRWPQFLPDGRHFIFLGKLVASTHQSGAQGIYVGSLDGAAPKLIVRTDAQAIFAAPGYLLYTQAGNLVAQRFEDRTLALTGEPAVVVEHVLASTLNNLSCSVSTDGKLLYQAGNGGSSVLSVVDRSGEARDAVAAGEFEAAALSPDGRRVAVGVMEPSRGTRDIWIYDLAIKSRTRLTVDPADDDHPIWSRDGRAIVFASTRTPAGLYEKPSDGARDEQPILQDTAEIFPSSWSPDGRNLVFDRVNAGRPGVIEVWMLPAGSGKAVPLVQNALSRSAQFSPDGRWLAYGSTQSGSVDVYLTSFPALSGQRQVSQAGGLNIRWRADGNEIFYLDLSSRVTGVEVTATAGGIQVGRTRTLFQLRPQDPVYAFDPFPDGQRFLVQELPEQASSTATLVTNWSTVLTKP